MSNHEPVKSYKSIELSSNRSFGFLLSIIIFIIAMFPIIKSTDYSKSWALIPSGLLLYLAFFNPDLLSPLNKLWFKFGAAIHKVVAPIIMFILFYIILTPVAICMRLLKKDLLQLKWTKNDTYWQDREVPGPDKGPMNKQF